MPPSTGQSAPAADSSAAPFDLSETFKLHSNPNAGFRIYLDFNGHTTSGTRWNDESNNKQPIVSPGYDPDGDGAAFNDNELALIQRIWQGVSEDFIPFNVDVTTEEPPESDLMKSGTGDTRWGIRVVMTDDQSWLTDEIGFLIGGIAYLGSFQWDSDTPTFVFNQGEAGVREAISHEVGHTLGLNHDGTSTQEYFGGLGSGPTSWGPIMGASYDVNVTQWSKGEYPDASNREDDLAIITDPSLNGAGFGYSGLSYRNDDHGSTRESSTQLVLANGVEQTGNGIIERNTDLDFFKFTTTGSLLELQLNPYEQNPNLDIEVKLYNSEGTVIATSSPTGSLSASLTQNLIAGTYYFSVDGVGEPGRYSDYGSLGRYSYKIKSTVIIPNDPPTNITLSSNTLFENMPTATTVGTFTATDPDVGNTFTFALVPGEGSTDNSKFMLHGAKLLTASSLNYEAKSSYSIRVRVTDQGGLTFEKVFTIRVQNVNEPPTSINLSKNTVAESQPAGTLVGVLSAVDPDENNTFNYSLVGGEGAEWNYAFRIEGNQLKTNTPLNYEFRPSYTVRVRATDQGGLSVEKVFTINATNVNEAPININLSKNTVAENLPAGALVGILSAVDPDANSTFTYSLVSGEGAEWNYAFQIDGNQLKTKTPLNFEFRNSYTVRVQARDQGGLTFAKVFTIYATDVNDAPVNINLSKNTVAENQPAGTLVGTLSAVDPDANNTFTYSLVSGEGAEWNYAFQIDGNQLKTKTPLNFEFRNSYTVRVQARDQGGLTFAKVFTINATNVNEAPVNINLSKNTVAENQPAGALVGILSAVDPDANNTFTYSLVSGEGAEWNYAFQIDGNQLKTKTPLNFEFRPSYTVRVQARDQGGLTFAKVFTINATDVNEAPVNIKLSANAVLENLSIGAVVGFLSTEDPDAGNTFSYSLVAGDGSANNAQFRIVNNQLQVNTTLNFRLKPSYTVRVRATDQGGLSVERVFSINILPLL